MATAELYKPADLYFDGSRPRLHRQEVIFQYEQPIPPPSSLLDLIGVVAEMRTNGIEVTSLAGGLPPKAHLEALWSTHFPTVDTKLQTLIQKGELQVESAAQYGSALGHENLRSWAADDITSLTGRLTDKSEIISTGGGLQYGLSATLLALCASENKVAITSKNTYSAFLEAAEVPGKVPVFSVESDNQGMLPDSLDQTLTKLATQNINPGLVYSMAISNPDGVIMTDERGRQLNDICKKHQVPFMVDYAYYKLALSNVPPEQVPKVDYFDDNVILGFTASKLGTPAERVGYMAIPNKENYTKIKDVKKSQMISSAARPELAFWILANEPGFDNTVRDLVSVYETGINAGLEAVAQNSDIFKADHPGGGMFLWVKVPEGISTYEVCGEILDNHHIAYSPGIWFQPGQIKIPNGEIIGAKPDDTYMRLCAVTESPEKVKDTINRLATAFRDIAKTRNIPLFQAN